MEIRELYRDEVAKLAKAGKETLRVRFPSRVEIRVLRENPRAFLPVAVAGTEIVGIALAELREDQRKRLGSVRLIASFVGEESVDRAIKLALLSRLEAKFKALGADEIEVPGDQGCDFLDASERSGYRWEAQDADPALEPARRRLVKQLRPALLPWARRPTSFSAGPRVVK